MIEAPPFQLTLHVTPGHSSAGTSRRSSVLEASDLSVEQARFPVLFPRNRGPYLLAGENRRDLRRFLTGGWLLGALKARAAGRAASINSGALATDLAKLRLRV